MQEGLQALAAGLSDDQIVNTWGCLRALLLLTGADKLALDPTTGSDLVCCLVDDFLLTLSAFDRCSPPGPRLTVALLAAMVIARMPTTSPNALLLHTLKPTAEALVAAYDSSIDQVWGQGRSDVVPDFFMKYLAFAIPYNVFMREDLGQAYILLISARKRLGAPAPARAQGPA